jgi:ring-1,2-phenylacetyl-CoA epoxidase subunit PaaD
MMEASAFPTTQQVWAWLSEIADPEIPAISITDLGIVRDVAWVDAGNASECVVTITPTYSGCPATAIIAQSITETLNCRGVANVRLKTQIFPAWTTNWLSHPGKAKLKHYGIAPPTEQVIKIGAIGRAARSDPHVACPRCGSTSTGLISQFGSTPCKALYRCHDCLEPFDYFKCH